MKKILVKTLQADNGKLLLYRKGNRESFEIDSAEIELYELKSEIKTLGNNILKTNDFYSIVINTLCEDLEFQKGDSFGLVIDLKRGDGIYERVYINSLRLIEIYNDKWVFEVDPDSLDWFKYF